MMRSKPNVDGKEQKLYAFVMVFGYSRVPFVIHTISIDQDTLLMCNVLAFMYFGGVPAELLYDNMETAFISSEEDKWRPNKHLLALASYYGFTPRRCQVRRPQTKDKVERFIHYYENNFWVEQKNKSLCLEELNEAVLEWIEMINEKTIGGLGESRKERFSDEQQIVRAFTVDLDHKNRRYYMPEHQEALKALWRRQFEPMKSKRPLPTPDVSVRSPDQYDRLIETEEVAKIISVTANVKHRLAILLIYSGGLRVSDAVVIVPDGVYVFEFKLNGTAEEALAQNNDRGVSGTIRVPSCLSGGVGGTRQPPHTGLGFC